MVDAGCYYAAMRRVFVAALLAIASGCHSSRPTRVIHVRVSADEGFRSRKAWTQVAAARLAAASRIFAAHGVGWDVTFNIDWVPEPGLSIERQRQRLGGYIGKDTIAIGFLTGPRDGSSGAAVPFDPRIVVIDLPARPESENEAMLARQLGRSLGAWDSSDPNSIMHQPPGTAVDATAAKVLLLTRDADFLKGVDGLPREKADALHKLWSESNPPANSHPMATFLDSYGRELLSKGVPDQAIEPLARALSYETRHFRHAMALGHALAASGRHGEAARAFAVAAEADPKSAAAANGWGTSLANDGRLNDSAKILRKAVAMSPENSQLHANLGGVLLELPDQAEEGKAELKLALELDPDNQFAARTLAEGKARAASRSADAESAEEVEKKPVRKSKARKNRPPADAQ
jgi:Tfp pilus assembly protein PilF